MFFTLGRIVFILALMAGAVIWGAFIKPTDKTQASPKCDPNYSGACVPNVYPSDVDCAGGSGNGPYYVQGPIKVIGTDRYHLDADGNGIGCED